ncbi:MAG: VapC toxin family PIN domain ribonuclease [Chloroflexi bacterium HGW-Chloroflexi-2]|jgi:predicted nucleic acid-binding protein|nr:MAG: VapC toxin family PIN domain ribonuclease [Chloroflexi bacterium HGW-Chloroflexi-2]
MNDKFFLDTNIFVYSFDDNEIEKKVRALSLIGEALQSGKGIISWQVVQEFLNVSTKKFISPLKAVDAKSYLQKVLFPLWAVFPNLNIYQNTIEIQEKTGYSFYDSMIVASALSQDCSILYSEELHNGMKIDDLQVINPFV